MRAVPPFQRANLYAMLAFAIVLVAIGLERWFTAGNIVPLGPGLLFLGAALTMFFVLRGRP